jgi:hypothetical protein
LHRGAVALVRGGGADENRLPNEPTKYYKNPEKINR